MSNKMNEALKVLANHGRVLREAAEDPLTFATHPSEIDSPEDIWASGESIALELDHAHVTHGAEEQVTEPETMKISELHKIIAAGIALREDRAGRLNVGFDVMGDTPQIVIQQSGYRYDLNEYDRSDFVNFLQDFEIDHSHPMSEGQGIADWYGIGFEHLPLEEGWNFIFDVIEGM